MINKRIYGQYFTNANIAKFMVNWIMENNPKNLLDPAVGEGIFIDNAIKINNKISITAFDIDISMCKKIYDKYNNWVSIKNQDYIYTANYKYDAIICNPPYNKFQKIRNRKNIINIFQQKYGISLSGYSNLCIYFLIKSINELSSNGRCCYIIPYEFLNTGYGKIVKEYLITSKVIDSIIKFDNSLKLFPDAITTSCILLIENKFHNSIKFVNVKNLKELEDHTYLNNNIYKYSDLKISDKWLKYFDNFQTNEYFNLIPMRKYATVKRGIATGNNAFFVLNTEKISKFGLSKNTCVPCITKSSDIISPIFNTIEFNKLRTSNKKIYLFNGSAAINQKDFEYIKSGENAGYHRTYLTSHRTPWYSIENKAVAPILLSVFCRNKIKVVRNEMGIKNLTTFHGIYFTNETTEDFINIFFCYLLTPIAQEVLFQNKREYGNGLDKFEPNDLNEAMIFDLKLIKYQDKVKILNIYNNLKNNDHIEGQVVLLNNIFKTYITKT